MKRAEAGQHFKRYVFDFVIYGYAMTKEEFLESERDCGADAEELEYQSRGFDRWSRMGLLFGKCYSVACVDGEYGSTPKNATIVISKDEFERAQKSGWK